MDVWIAMGGPYFDGEFCGVYATESDAHAGVGADLVDRQIRTTEVPGDFVVLGAEPKMGGRHIFSVMRAHVEGTTEQGDSDG